MPIDPVKIPQNVYVEDRIIGPVTLRQIMIILGGAGVSYGIWAVMKAAGPVSVVQTGVAWLPCVIAVLFAFVSINGISLFRIVLLAIERVNKPSRRTWQPREGISINIVTKTPQKENEDLQKKKEQKENTAIEELSKVLDQGPPESTMTPVTTAEPTSNSRKPVNPKKIQANTSKDASIDNITVPKKKPSSSSGGLLRDIIPPQSHA